MPAVTSTRHAAALAALLAALTAGCARAEPLSIEDAWVRAAPPGAPALAAYARFRNTGEAALRITPCATTGFGSVALHETIDGSDGVARMRPLEGLVVPAGGEAVLAPGGAHLMLMGPQAVPAAGQSLALCLEVDGVAREVPFEVRRTGAAEPPHRH